MFICFILLRKVRVPSGYIIGGHNLKKVSHICDLGVVLSDDLSFSEHNNIIYNKAIRNLGFIKRNCSEFNNHNCLITLYTALVRSVLEFGSVI
jgi:hypothetical protein